MVEGMQSSKFQTWRIKWLMNKTCAKIESQKDAMTERGEGNSKPCAKI
jgi:hypothetical protein